MVDDDVTCDTKRYMRTDTDYNSCVYDLEADLDDLPSNLVLNDTEDINSILKDTIGLTRKAYFKLTTDRTVPIGVINLLGKFRVFTEKVVRSVLIDSLVNTVNCDQQDNRLTGTLKNKSTAETPLLQVKDYSKIGYLGSDNLTIEVYDSNGDLIKTITHPTSDILSHFDVNDITTNEAYFKFKFKSGQYFEALNCYTQDEEIITTINNKSTNKRSKPIINTSYTIMVNGNHVKTHQKDKDIRNKTYTINTGISTSFKIIADNTKLEIKNKH